MMKETLGGHLRAEFIRLKRSATLWFSLIGLLIGVLSILLSGGTRAAGFESAVFSWQVMYFTGMAAPLMMVLAAIQESRDKNARMAGLAWRGANPRYAQLARLCGAGIAALCFQALSYGSIILIAAAPVGGGLIGFFYSWVGALGYIALGSLVARYVGIVGALFAGIAWQILGGVFAESHLWWLVPAAWPIRILLEPTGVNFNGSPMDPDNPVLNDPAGVGVVLSLAFALIVGSVACRTATNLEGGSRLKTKALATTTTPAQGEETSAFTYHFSTPADTGATDARLGRRGGSVVGVMSAVLMTVRRSGAWELTGLAVVVVVLLAVTYEPAIVSQVVTFFLFPIGVGLLPVLTWKAFNPGYVPLHVRNHAVTPTYLGVHVLVLSILVVVLALALLLSGMPAGEVALRSLLWLLVGSGLALVALALTARFGTPAALGALVVWTLLGLLLGGDVLADTFLWLVAVPAWPHIGITGARLALAVAGAVLLILMGFVASVRALARVRRDS